jgi:hypothetical protein
VAGWLAGRLSSWQVGVLAVFLCLLVCWLGEFAGWVDGCVCWMFGFHGSLAIWNSWLFGCPACHSALLPLFASLLAG